MPYSHVELKKFIGLYLQPNSFTVPDGALEQAENCVITMDNVITKRRGNFSFYTPVSGTLNNLFVYQDQLIAVLNDRIEWVNSSGSPTVLGGVTVSETPPRKARGVQANENLYLTSDNGVLKLEAYNSDVLSAGIPPALDLRGHFTADNGPIGGDCQVAYRILFGRTDANDNLNIGAPSDVLILANRPVIGSSYTSSGAGPYTITVTTANVHNLSTGMTVSVSNATNTNANGDQIITVTGTNTFTYDVASNPASGTLDYSVTRSTSLEFSIPDEIDSTEYFVQIYRSSQSASASVAPFADFKLIKQRNLTSTEISENVGFFLDDVLVIFEGAELYTNPNSREGEAQANERPPLCVDMCLFKNFVFYANTTGKHFLEVDLSSTNTSFIADGNYIEFKQGGVTRRYVARNGVGNNTVTTEVVTGTTNITATYTNHGLLVGDVIYVTNVDGTITQAEYTITAVTANTFDFTAGTGETATKFDFEGVKNAANYYIFQLVPPATSISVGIDLTARGIVKAINRDPSATIYARYISGISDIPGKMLFQSQTFTTDPIQVRAENTTVGQAFSPELPAAFGSTVQSKQDVNPNGLAISKIGEPEAVPLVNLLPVGSKNKKILRVFALRDSVIVLKEDGVWRVDGDAVTNFVATILDGTVICVAPRSAGLINNTVACLSNQGVCFISSTSVQIISRKIEAPIAAVLGYAGLEDNTSAVTYESERLYLLTTMAPNTNTASVVYCYNTLTDAWTTWDSYFSEGIVGPSDKLFLITTGNKIVKERKNQNKLDYAGEAYSATCLSMAPNGLVGTFSVTTVDPVVGDVVVFSNIINRISDVEPDGSNFIITFESASNIHASDVCQLYQKFDSTVKIAPFHAGQTNRSKQFCQTQVHTKGPDISRLDISYSNDTFGSSEFTTWTQVSVAQQGGWGQLPWGFFPWGLESGINLTYSTQPSPVIRTYVPLFAQRSTFLQVVLQHKAAAEPMNIQAIGFQVRGYGERVSR